MTPHDWMVERGFDSRGNVDVCALCGTRSALLSVTGKRPVRKLLGPPRGDRPFGWSDQMADCPQTCEDTLALEVHDS